MCVETVCVWRVYGECVVCVCVECMERVVWCVCSVWRVCVCVFVCVEFMESV